VGASVISRITPLAAAQCGAVSIKQLRAAGVTWKAQNAAISSGWLAPVEPTVLVVAGSPDTWHRRLWIGLLALDGHGWVSHDAAASLHGLDRARPDAVEFTVPRRYRTPSCSALVHTTDSIGPVDVLTLAGLRCSSATRTILDLARARIPTVRLEAAIDSAVRLGLSAPLVLERRLSELRGPGRWGAPTLDRLLIDSGGESLLERRFLALMRKGRLPRPITQARQRRDGRHIARVDFLFAAYPVVVEVTGRLGHSTPRERDRDAQRRNELIDLGFRVYEYTWHHVTERRAWVIATMRRRLTAAGWTPLLSPSSAENAGLGDLT
jgi:very-short-patch-repair endonuclease